MVFPRHFHVHAKDLIKKLLSADRTRRIGCLKGGAEDVKKTRWFNQINFSDLELRKMDGPIVPAVQGEADTSQFEDYPDSVEDPAAMKLAPHESRLFADF